MARHGEGGGDPGLVLELGQGGTQCRLDVFFAGARAKVHQQFAHIRIALPHAHIELAHAAVARHKVALGHSIAQQLRLDLQESQ